MKIVNNTAEMMIVIIPKRHTECLNPGTYCEAEFNAIFDHITAHCDKGSCIFWISPESFSTGVAKYDHSSFGNLQVRDDDDECCFTLY